MKRTKLSVARRQLVFCRDGYKCVYCSKEATTFEVKRSNVPYRLCIIPYDENHREFEIDHIVPYRETQDNSFYNLATCCWNCNSKKSSRLWKHPYIKKLPI